MLYPAPSISIVGQVTQTSVQSPVMRIFFLPVASIAARNPESSQEFIEVRSTTGWPGKTSRSWGQTYPLKDSVSTAVRTAGTPDYLATLARRGTVLISVVRSIPATPYVIFGW